MTDNQCNITLREELQNQYINFIDGFGNTQYMFDFVNNTLCGELTNWKEIRIKENIRYKQTSDISGNYYIGSYNENNYKNMMAIIFKISVKKHIFSPKQRYIFMIIDNPYYKNISITDIEKSKYKLIIFNLCQQGVYVNYLTENSIYSSTI